MGIQNKDGREWRHTTVQGPTGRVRERASSGRGLQSDFGAVVDISTVKVILAFAVTWKVPTKHGDIPSAYVKANKDEHLEIYR